jgi:hypothetical protein
MTALASVQLKKNTGRGSQGAWRGTMGWTAKELLFDSWQKKKFFLFSEWSISALGPTQPLVHCVLQALSPSLKRPVHETIHSPPRNIDFKRLWIYTSTPPHVFVVCCLIN